MIGKGWQTKFYSLTLSLLLILSLADRVGANIYIYRDKEGILHFTNLSRHPGYRLYLKTRPDRAPKGVNDWVIKEIALKHGLPPALIKAIIKVESDFDPKAVSPAGALGLMQLKPITAQEVGIQNPFSPVENIEGGVKYLKKMLYQFGSLEKALGAYYLGPDRINDNINRPDVKKYIEKVLYYYQIYKNQF